MTDDSRRTVMLLLPLLALVSLPLLGSGDPPGSDSATPRAKTAGKYIGAAKCKSCHSSAETGNQYEVWERALHSHAYETLATSPQAKESAAALGIEEPAKADDCLKCHVTGHGQPADSFARGWKQELGVQCETCHGPGDDHMKARFKAAANEKGSGGYQPLPQGEMVVDPGVELCVKCHNPGSPNYKPFCYFEYRAKIAHFNPKKPRSDEEKANYGKCPSGSPCAHADGCPEGTCNLRPEELAAMKRK